MKFYCLIVIFFILPASLWAISNRFFKGKFHSKQNINDAKRILDYEIIKKMTFSFQQDYLTNITQQASIYYIGTTFYLSDSFHPDLVDNKQAILCASVNFNDSLFKIGYALFFWY